MSILLSHVELGGFNYLRRKNKPKGKVCYKEEFAVREVREYLEFLDGTKCCRP
jgi:hypothetical protein